MARSTESEIVRLPERANDISAGEITLEVQRQLGEFTLDAIYRDKVLSQRTRQYELRAPTRFSRVEILHTLLGIELKMGNRRVLCPDLATARYLSVFAQVGCQVVAVPYDITQVSHVADLLESSLNRLRLLAEHLTEGRSARLRTAVVKRIVSDARSEITRLGAGAKIPAFNQNTRQRV